MSLKVFCHLGYYERLVGAAKDDGLCHNLTDINIEQSDNIILTSLHLLLDNKH